MGLNTTAKMLNSEIISLDVASSCEPFSEIELLISKKVRMQVEDDDSKTQEVNCEKPNLEKESDCEILSSQPGLGSFNEQYISFKVPNSKLSNENRDKLTPKFGCEHTEFSKLFLTECSKRLREFKFPNLECPAPTCKRIISHEDLRQSLDSE